MQRWFVECFCPFQLRFKHFVHSISVVGKSARSASDVWPQVASFDRSRTVQQRRSSLRRLRRRGAGQRSRDTTREQGSRWRHDDVTGTCRRWRVASGNSAGSVYLVLYAKWLYSYTARASGVAGVAGDAGKARITNKFAQFAGLTYCRR